MFIIVDGDKDYNNYDNFVMIMSKLKDTMLVSDHEFTIFCTGPDNIFSLVKKIYDDNSFIDKRIKFYNNAQENVEKYGYARFKYNVYFGNNIYVKDSNGDIINV